MHSLCNQQPIKWVTVVQRQFIQRYYVLQRDWQNL